MTSRLNPALGLAALLALLAGVTAADAPKKPPQTKSDIVKETLHGVEIADPYRWLEDQKSPETRKWIDEQNAYTDSLLNPIAGRDKLKQRLTELLKIDSVGMPTQAGGRYFFSKRLADQDQAIIYVRQGLTGKDEVLIDPHPLSPDRTTSVSLLSVSDDGKLLAYGIRQGGEDEVVVQLFDVDTRKALADKLPKARYFGVSIKPDRSGFYYTHFGKEGPRVRYHAMGEDIARDVEIFGKGYGPEKIISAGLSENGKHLLISVMYGSAPKKIELWHQDAATKDAPVKPVVTDIEARFSGDFAGDRLLIETNWKAPNNRILEASLTEPAEKWKEVVPEGKSVLQGFSLVGGKLFGNYLENVTSRLRIFDLTGKALGEIPFETLGTCSGISGRFDSPEAFYSFTSFALPPTIYRYDTAKGTQDVWAKLNIPRGHIEDRGQAGLVRIEGQNQDPDVPGLHEGAETGRHASHAPDRLRRLQPEPDARVFVAGGGVGGAWRRVRPAQPARRRRVRRGLAQGRHARQEAERLRRFHRRGGVADQGEIHQFREARASAAAATAACWSGRR